MKKIVLAAVLLMAANSFAADIMYLKRGVVFNHLGHQTEKVGLCSACHVETEGTPGKIPGLGKDWAHRTCIECHDIFEKGPTKCDGCHTKK
ncbi:MAG: cytochrome C [Geobacteraceae bacterium]|nr:cytochrome C [Geobacteraceae bacterium]